MYDPTNFNLRHFNPSCMHDRRNYPVRPKYGPAKPVFLRVKNGQAIGGDFVAASGREHSAANS
ncbi:hypothetical protein D3C78_699560 [compost metagenome]